MGIGTALGLIDSKVAAKRNVTYCPGSARTVINLLSGALGHSFAATTLDASSRSMTDKLGIKMAERALRRRGDDELVGEEA